MKPSGYASVPPPTPPTQSPCWTSLHSLRSSFGKATTAAGPNMSKVASIRIAPKQIGTPIPTETKQDFTSIAGTPGTPYSVNQSFIPPKPMLANPPNLKGSFRVHWNQRQQSPRSARLNGNLSPRKGSQSPVRDSTPLLSTVSAVRDRVPYGGQVPECILQDRQSSCLPNDGDMKTLWSLLERMQDAIDPQAGSQKDAAESVATTTTDLVTQSASADFEDVRSLEMRRLQAEAPLEVRRLKEELAAMHLTSKRELQNFMISLKTQVTEEILEICKIEVRNILQREVHSNIDYKGETTMSKLQAYCEDKILAMESTFRNELMTTVTNFAEDFVLLQNQLSDLQKSTLKPAATKASIGTSFSSATPEEFSSPKLSVPRKCLSGYSGGSDITASTQTSLFFIEGSEDLCAGATKSVETQLAAKKAYNDETIVATTALDEDVVRDVVSSMLANAGADAQAGGISEEFESFKQSVDERFEREARARADLFTSLQDLVCGARQRSDDKLQSIIDLMALSQESAKQLETSLHADIADLRERLEKDR